MHPHPLLSRWRAETPAAAAGRIHLNNAGASLMPTPVDEAIRAHLDLETRLGGYEAAEAAADGLRADYDAVAEVLGTTARNIAVVENATVAFAQALSAFDFAPGDAILTTRNDYVSNQLMYLSLATRRGVRIVRAEDAVEGGVDPGSVADLLEREGPRLVAVTWVPTNSGLVQPVEAVGAVCREAGVPFIVDACQAVGQIPIDVRRIGCDYLSGTARKFLRGPRGVGFLYVADGALDRGDFPLLVDMQGAEWTGADAMRLADSAARFENWEFAYALVRGLGAAARYALDVDIDRGGGRATELARYARERLAGVDGVRVLDRGPELCAIVSVDVGADAEEVSRELREWGINTGASPRAHALIDLTAKGVGSTLRLSPHYYNTHEEIDAAVACLRRVLAIPP